MLSRKSVLTHEGKMTSRKPLNQPNQNLEMTDKYFCTSCYKFLEVMLISIYLDIRVYFNSY
jgi:hypothetical protein